MFLLFYGSGLLLGAVWPVFRHYRDTLILATMGAACFVNFRRHRTLHCGITGPIFALTAVVAALGEGGIWHFDWCVLWGVVLVAVGIAFVFEWRTVRGQ
jgi:hypothetical protein